MDYDNNEENRAWQGEDYHFKKDMNNEESQSLYEQVPMNKEDQSYMFDISTPVKACRNLTYHAIHTENTNKKLEVRRDPSSQLKRRRMLQFDNQISPLCKEEMPSLFLKSNESMESVQEDLSQSSDWTSAYGDLSASASEGLEESSEWFADCFNDTNMDLISDNMNCPGLSDLLIDVSEFCNNVPASEGTPVQNRTTQSLPKVIFKDMKSFIGTPTKLASSIAHPFGFIKPCSFNGDVTLKDINQIIHTPPSSKSNQNCEDLGMFPTSAFSGKPVVGKTRIRTGGKGSITIMRTKG